MDAVARIPFSNALLDPSQTPSIKVIEVDGQIKLCITLGIKANKIKEVDEPSEEIKEGYRDATINRELLLDGRLNIILQKIPATPREKTSNFVIRIEAHSDTKIPGTGSDVFFEDFIQ